MKYLLQLLLIVSYCAVGYAQPTDNAMEPPARDGIDVIGIYGDAYGLADITNYDPNWGQTGHQLVNPSFDPGTGSVIMAYPSFNYQGTEFNGVDASLFEFLHVDIWVPAGIDRMVMVTPIDNSGAGPVEVLVPVPLTPGEWNSVDLAKEDFTDMSWNSLFQLKFDGQFNSDGTANAEPFDLYIDNVYFWKSPVATGTDATLSDIQVDDESIAGFASAQLDYTFGVSGGSSAIPQVTMATSTDATASVNITQADAVPGTATITVTSANGANAQTYSITYAYDSPVEPAPAPSADASAVISMFSDAYNDVAVDTWNTEWSEASFADGDISGDAVKIYTDLGFNGVETIAAPIDATTMVFFNMDVWSPNMDNVLIKLVDFLGDGFAGSNGDTEAEITTPVTKGEWMTIQIPLADFTAGGMSAINDINQLVITSQPFGTGILYVDNVYFSTMSVNTAEEQVLEASVYPNPMSAGETLLTSGAVDRVEVYGIDGRLVSQSSTQNIPTLTPGQYVVRLQGRDGSSTTTKLIVQ
jgi:hypothetical protein